MTEPAFGDPAQARAFAMVRALLQAGTITPREWADALGAEAARGPGDRHDDRWLAALETLVVRMELASATALARHRAAWAHAATRTAHGRPIVLEGGDFADRSG